MKSRNRRSNARKTRRGGFGKKSRSQNKEDCLRYLKTNEKWFSEKFGSSSSNPVDCNALSSEWRFPGKMAALKFWSNNKPYKDPDNITKEY